MRAPWPLLRDGTWLDLPRLRRIALVLALAYLGLWIWSLGGRGHLDPGGRPVGSDFSFFYGTSWAIRHGASVPSLYDPARFNDEIRAFTGGGSYLWFYPPTAVFLFYPIAALGYLPALAAWILAGLAAYLAVARAILPGRLALAGFLVFPGVQVALLHGQNSLFLASTIGGGLVLLPRAPALAGLLVGLASFKPQFGILLPFALLAGARWWALACAAATTLGLGLLAGAVFGFESWVRFLDAYRLAGSLLESQGVPYFKLASVFSAVRLAGGSSPVAWAIQGAVSAVAAAWLVTLWRGRASQDLKSAGAVVATLLAVPYLYDYDLPLLALGLGFWLRSVKESGWLPWEKTLIFALWILPLLARPVAQWAHLGLVPPLLAAAATGIAARARATRAPA